MAVTLNTQDLITAHFARYEQLALIWMRDFKGEGNDDVYSGQSYCWLLLPNTIIECCTMITQTYLRSEKKDVQTACNSTV